MGFFPTLAAQPVPAGVFYWEDYQHRRNKQDR